ncbi:class III lanthionine synthetase LanKC N-terminal domain-containing protein [Actinomadura hibisca]|uniref:class III lanthionine synthetase LanKC N-terminal domain-containing protein n=1 Tax=Actinomadura hibisca TaxID=68565 RepID=UPI00082A8907|nr:lanthionine synthetase LanC family protein [Actinomadura hibisca]
MDLGERIEAAAGRRGLSVRTGRTWISVRDPTAELADQGWKLHVSARPVTLAETVERALPVLLEAAPGFKVVSGADILGSFNSSGNGTGSTGKAITVYPAQDAVAEVGALLVAALRGLDAPVIKSDRRVHPDAPVYYRYGPFRPRYRATRNGDYELVVVGPDGQTYPGEAGPAYRCPDWARDPFHDEPGDLGGARILGGRYRLVSGISCSPRGNVYRAVDLEDEREVVVKQARAYIGEREDGTDVRTYLRNERRVLHVLAGVSGVPAVLDHFRHGADEFLVVSSAGERDLRQDVAEHGPYRSGPSGQDSCGQDSERDLTALARKLVALLDAVHGKGVVYRDLAPKNVVLDGDGRCHLVDFDISRFDGEQRSGWTPGYAPPGQNQGVAAVPADDYYALGATLFYAATGLDPVRMHDQEERNVTGTLAALGALGLADSPAVAAIPRLLDADPAERVRAVADLRERAVPGGRAASADHRRGGRLRPVPLPALPASGPAELEEIIAHTVTETVRYAREMVEAGGDPPRPTNAHLGGAGIGAELLQHGDRPDVRHAVHDLVRWSLARVRDEEPAHGLLFGSAGPAIFLAMAAADSQIGLDRFAGRAKDDQSGFARGLTAPEDAATGPSRTNRDVHGADDGSGRVRGRPGDPADLRTPETGDQRTRAAACIPESGGHRAWPVDAGSHAQAWDAQGGEARRAADGSSDQHGAGRGDSCARFAAPRPGDRDDFAHGLAGTGAGHLILAELESDSWHLERAAECAHLLANGQVSATADEIPPSPPGSGVHPEWGLAHGTAGIVSFLLAEGRTAMPEAERRCAELAAVVPELVEAAGRPTARPMVGSWCQGLAGIGVCLLAASAVLNDDRMLDLAADAGRACLRTAPTMAVLSQCCGMAGAGELLIDLAVATGSEEFMDGAHRVLGLMLARSGGSPGRPVFPDHSLTAASGPWGVGTAGVLTFLRRLRDGGGPRPWTIGGVASGTADGPTGRAGDRVAGRTVDGAAGRVAGSAVSRAGDGGASRATGGTVGGAASGVTGRMTGGAVGMTAGR